MFYKPRAYGHSLIICIWLAVFVLSYVATISQAHHSPKSLSLIKFLSSCLILNDRVIYYLLLWMNGFVWFLVAEEEGFCFGFWRCQGLEAESSILFFISIVNIFLILGIALPKSLLSNGPCYVSHLWISKYFRFLMSYHWLKRRPKHR